VVHEKRSKLLDEINPIFKEKCSKILAGPGNCSREIKPGWDISERLLDCLKRNREKVRKLLLTGNIKC